MLGVMIGLGKFILYYVFFLGFVICYSFLELRFYLIDGKYGVELVFYCNLFYIEVVFLYFFFELFCSVLKELSDEKEWCNVLFKRLGVLELLGYWVLG